MPKRAAENRERKAAECAPRTTTSGGSCSRSPRPETAPKLALRAKKIPTDKGWDFKSWWRWGELNPRPPILRFRYYMFFLFLILTRGYPTGRENHERFRISFRQSTPDALHDDLVRVDAWNLNAQARLQSDGTLLVIKQRVRSCRRWQLNFLQIFTRLYPSTCT